ncbi:MAG TPA: peptidoglycan DD-metalloendopeptidase family protein [Chitinophagaceae bacterium]|nr:peptidoglycan DD-metalloendopeptidase family protein [Chitinophagaceae bacterium]
MTRQPLIEVLRRHSEQFHAVVPFNSAKEKLLLFDFTKNNNEIFDEMINDTQKFTNYVNKKLQTAGAKFGIGGYNEHRELYSRSTKFSPDLTSPDGGMASNTESLHVKDTGQRTDRSELSAWVTPPSGEAEGAAEARRLHLGIDIWGRPYTSVMSPLDGVVHSFAFNDDFGDYGATIILSHNIDGVPFHTLYGHLSFNSIKNLREGESVRRGDVIGEFGIPMENGQWPPHLHFQLVDDIGEWRGDYPGVCKYSERDAYLENCPDPDLILGMMEYAIR